MDYLAITRIHGVYRNMHSRCTVAHNKSFADYGGRGICVDPTWVDFNIFCRWALENGYQSGLQLDRIDNDGPYSPENCRWVTQRVNAQNKRNNKFLTAFGETKTLSEWARDPRCVVEAHVLSSRKKAGWSDEACLVTPSTRTSDSCINGHARSEHSIKRPSGTWFCRRCHADRQSERYYANKGKK